MVVVLDSAPRADGGRGVGAIADKLLVGRHLDKVKNRIKLVARARPETQHFSSLGQVDCQCSLQCPSSEANWHVIVTGKRR